MQYKRVIMFFLVALPLSIIMRLLQLKYVIDAKTGFFLPQFNIFGYAILIIFFVVAFMFALFSFTTHRSPEHTPKHSIPLCVFSFIAAFGIFCKTFLSNIPLSAQTLLLNISALLAIAFFIAFGLKKYFDFKLPEFTYIFPCIYFIFDIIREFTAVSSLSVISDNILLIASLCSMMIFSLQFAKLYNSVDREYNFRKLLASGLVSSLFCFVQSIPYFIFNTVSSTPNNHTSFGANLGLLCFGCFVVTFIGSHFSRKNACVEI